MLFFFGCSLRLRCGAQLELPPEEFGTRGGCFGCGHVPEALEQHGKACVGEYVFGFTHNELLRQCERFAWSVGIGERTNEGMHGLDVLRLSRYQRLKQGNCVGRMTSGQGIDGAVDDGFLREVSVCWFGYSHSVTISHTQALARSDY
jgi:hypothetical protein